jgi:hypothetical protein
MKIEEINKKKLIESRILAKATFMRGDGRFDIIAVHDLSTQSEYYIQYSARSKRSPRKSWKFIRAFARDLDPLHWQDFASFNAHFAETHKENLVSSRILVPRGMAVLVAKTETQLTPSINPAITMQVMWTMRDVARGIYKQKFKGLWVNRIIAAGTLSNYVDRTDVPEGEVHVYQDDCPTCLKWHLIAHYPNGNIICADLADSLRNPALEYGGFSHGRFTLRFKNPANLQRSSSTNATTARPASKPAQIRTGTGESVSNDLSAPKPLFLGRE